MPDYARKMLGKDKPYEDFLKYILDQDYIYDEDKSFPTINDLSAQSDIS